MINLVKIISTEIDDLNRRIVKVLRLGQKDVQTPFEASPFGLDSNCPKDLIAVYAATGEKGKAVIIGYLNKNAKSDVGELRLFSTDKAGTEKFYVWLKNDGFLELGGKDNYAVKFNELKTEFNKLKSNFNSHLIEYNTHLHGGGIGPFGNTLVPTITSTQTNSSNIDNAKNAKIKTIG